MPENFDEFNRQDDLGDRPDREDPRRLIERAKSALLPPAIIIIIFGALGLLNGVYSLYTMTQFDKAWDDAIKQQQTDPKMTPQQKQEVADMMAKIKDYAKILIMASGTAGILGALIMLIGGIRMIGLKSRGLAYFASILSMIPFVTGCCCIIGIPIGIWAIVVLGKPDVKAAFELTARGA